MDDDFDELADDRASWSEWRQGIDDRLNHYRPSRIGSDEKDWREPVYGWARLHMPDETQLVRIYAEREVNRRETEALKTANRYLRRWWQGEAPLSWEILGPLPVKVGDVRVRLDVATPEDIEAAARELKADAEATYKQVLSLCDAHRDLATRARNAGFINVSLIGDLPPHGEADQRAS